jgi:hypothetical protein
VSSSLLVSQIHTALGMLSHRVAMKLPSKLQLTLPAPEQQQYIGHATALDPSKHAMDKAPKGEQSACFSKSPLIFLSSRQCIHSPTPSLGLGLSKTGRTTGTRSGSSATTYRDLVTAISPPSSSTSCHKIAHITAFCQDGKK